MLTKNNNRFGYISRIAALPLFLFVFAGFTFKTAHRQPVYKGAKTIVVIDAGHGGKDFGADAGNNVYEKDISLLLAKKVKELNRNENIDIILTRETDIYQSPTEKADFANNANASLLVSVHIAAEGGKKNKESGMFVYVSKNEFPNSPESKVLASAMIQTFKSAYPLPIQNSPVQRQKGIWLLQASKCPSILIEPGYITNSNDLAFLQTEKGQETIAQNILNGIEKYLTATIKETTNSENVDAPDNNIGNISKKALLIVDGQKNGTIEAM